MENNEKKELIKFSINREDSLNNSRLTWLLAFQGLLFASFASIKPGNVLEPLVSVKFLLPPVGAVSALATLVVLYMGMHSLHNLQNMWNKLEPHEEVTPFGLQKPGTGYIFSFLGPSSLLPLFCIIAWVTIFCKLKVGTC